MEKPPDICGQDLIDSYFPSKYSYELLSFEIVEKGSLPFNNLNFDLELRVNVSSESEVYNFLKEFNISSSCTFNVLSGRPDKKADGPKARSLLRGFRKCCMFVKTSKDQKPQQEGKNTSCNASLNFRLEMPNTRRGKDKETKKEKKKDYPLWMKMHFNHNHTLNRAEYFRFLSVSAETEAFFEGIFRKGMQLHYLFI